MVESLGLADALAASEKHRALYQDSVCRAFVSERDVNFDFGVRGPLGKVTRFDQTDATLRLVLSEYGVPVDAGWKPQ